MSDKVDHALRNRRARQLLVELAAHPAGLAWSEIWPRMDAAEPWTSEELETVGKNQPKGQYRLQWTAHGMDKSGWVLTAAGPLRITRAGQAALETLASPDDQWKEQERLYGLWDEWRNPALEPVALDARTDILPTEDGERILTGAATGLLHRGLVDATSAFDPTIAAWAEPSVDELYERFVVRADMGSDSFLTKLAGQLAGAPDEVILLAAELLALVVLPLSDWRSDTKRQRVKQVLALMDRPVHLDPRTSGAMDHQAFRGGVAFKTQIWRQLASLIGIAREWHRVPPDQRAAVWDDPWQWRDLLARQDADATASVRGELAFLRHPEVFPPIVSTAHKGAVLGAFSGEVAEPSGDLDRDLRDTVLSLQAKSGGPVDFYRTPFVERWRSATETTGGGRRAWLVRGSSVKGRDLVAEWLEEGFVSLAGSQLAEVDLPVEAPELRALVEEGYGRLPYAKREEKQRDFHAFLLTFEPGDLVVTTSGGRLYAGTLDGQPEQVLSAEGRSNLRWPVEWSEPLDGVEFSDLPAPVTARLRGGSDVADLTEVADQVSALMVGPLPDGGDDEDDEPAPVVVEPVMLDRLDSQTADALLVDRDWLDELVVLLNEKRQVILYGPPGTGKTFLAQKVADAVAPAENVRLVQFHPAYSYEDFFEGYRPTRTDGGQVGFALKSGPFRRIAEDAREHPDQPYVLIVDEINRGNLAKIFGELYFLLEYRDEAVSLLYAEEDTAAFSLPSNVFLVGTMNTADRSIALVDSAMRRRFAFLSLHPDDDHLGGVLTQWLDRRDLPGWVAEVWVELNRRIPDDDFKVGPSYLMSDAVGTEEGLARIWRTSVLPLLAELHYGDGTNVTRRYGLQVLRAAVGAAAAEPKTGPAEVSGGDTEGADGP